MFISEDVKYVGVNDTTIDLFEGQYKVPDGISPQLMQQAKQGVNMQAVNQLQNAMRQTA